ncbi:MAG: TrmB family transcriptional regulator sugar-binding domain-containing protein [Nocardioidaceae bacterium]
MYSNAVAHGALSTQDPRLAEGTELWPAVKLLLDIGLLRHDTDAQRYLPVDPTLIQSQIVVPLSQQGSELLAESARWADLFSNLGQAFRTVAGPVENPITEIHGLENINNFLDSAIADARTELLTAQPHGKRQPKTLALAEERDIRAIERGVKMRTLYQHSARHSPATREYVADVIARGAEVRTLDEFFRRLIVVDRQVAVIPATDDRTVAIAIHDRSLVLYLVDIFNRSWERALPFSTSGKTADRTVAKDVREMTIRLLVEGHSDPASAKRLGISPRTYAGYIAALKDEYGSQTRFQLGYAMGQAAAHMAMMDIEEDLGDPESRL